MITIDNIDELKKIYPSIEDAIRFGFDTYELKNKNLKFDKFVKYYSKFAETDIILIFLEENQATNIVFEMYDHGSGPEFGQLESFEKTVPLKEIKEYFTHMSYI